MFETSFPTNPQHKTDLMWQLIVNIKLEVFLSNAPHDMQHFFRVHDPIVQDGQHHYFQRYWRRIGSGVQICRN